MNFIYSTIKTILRKTGIEIKKYQKPAFYEKPFPFQRYVVNNLIKTPKPVIFDLGANVGDIALIYKNILPDASIYCFEPVNETAQTLKENISKESNISVHSIALSDFNGKSDFNININNDVNSFFQRPENDRKYYPDDGKFIGKTTINVKKLDSFTEEQSINHINILKMDIEGSELAALKGAKNLLQQAKIDLIYLECSFIERFTTDPDFGEIMNYLKTFGYSFHNFYNFVTDSKNGQLTRADAIFLNSETRRLIDQL